MSSEYLERLCQTNVMLIAATKEVELLGSRPLYSISIDPDAPQQVRDQASKMIISLGRLAAHQKAVLKDIEALKNEAFLEVKT